MSFKLWVCWFRGEGRTGFSQRMKNRPFVQATGQESHAEEMCLFGCWKRGLKTRSKSENFLKLCYEFYEKGLQGSHTLCLTGQVPTFWGLFPSEPHCPAVATETLETSLNMRISRFFAALKLGQARLF